jgi:hypothetical protein
LDNIEGLQALIGVYYLKNKNLLHLISKSINNTQRIEISELLEPYKKFEDIKCVDCDSWFDIGHLDKYYQAKIQLVQSRYFNRLKFEPMISVITKESDDKEKLVNEVKWYLNLPKQISLLASRIIDYDLGDKPFIKLEYYGYPTLSELFLFGELHYRVWESIIDKLIAILNIMRNYKGHVSINSYRSMYLTKTLERIARLSLEDPDFKRIFSFKTIYLNGEELLNIEELIPYIKKTVEHLYCNSEENNCIVHGDFCFSNILYDVNSGIVRLIDPRGMWGDGFYGDIRYDVAKLRHSIVGKYDFLTNDLFTLKCSQNSFDFAVNGSIFYTKIEKILDSAIGISWNIEEIKFIEGLLFCSMVPLHKDNKNRQIAMYCTGLKLLNEVYRKDSLRRC